MLSDLQEWLFHTSLQVNVMTKSRTFTFPDVTKCSLPPVLSIFVFCPNFNPNVICSLGISWWFCVLSCSCFPGNTELKLSHICYLFQVRHSGYRVIKCNFFFILKTIITTALQLSIHHLIFFTLVIDEWCLKICFWTNFNWSSKFHKITLKKEMELHRLSCSPCVV